MKRSICFFIFFCLFLLFSSCTTDNVGKKKIVQVPLYQELTPKKSGISFVNKLTENNNVNYFFYPDLYEGGGVAVGDINNDGLPDIYFTSILVRNALYLNKGNLEFEDITNQAEVHGAGKWTRGVTMTDINNDGYLDIYVSVSGPLANRKNLLFINNKDNTFKEQAEAYGIADTGYSIQSAFFDYDKDGDLDLFVGTNPPSPFQSQNSYYATKIKNPGLDETDRLYQNEGNGHFVDVTEEAGITNFGLTLGISVSDLNNDGWLDIYVSNDFNSPDYFYVNNGDGTFSNEIQKYFMHTSQFGMGCDAADFNNDGLIDLVQLDMSYSSNRKKKTNMPTMWPEQFFEMIELGLHWQYMRNCLQLNTGLNVFSDVAYLAGITSTDWSWSSLFFDMNNDGQKDLFITNGMRRDVNDNDFLNFVREQDQAGNIDPTNSMALIEKMPINPVDNFVFLNEGDLNFNYQEGNHGLSFTGFSYGAAYADLDNDGDLDVVLNNLDHQSQIFENLSSDRLQNNYLRFKLRSNDQNNFAIGSKILLYNKGEIQLQELMTSRGYISSVEPVLHFGLAQTEIVDSVVITWPDGKQHRIYDISANQVIELNQTDQLMTPLVLKKETLLFDVSDLELNPPYVHVENEYNDFDREVLLPHKMSQFGPALAIADVNHDGLEDFYIGGAMNHSGRMYIQDKSGKFKSSNDSPWLQAKQYEDVSAIFFDANGDGSPDLYVASGGNEKGAENPYYQDRLFVNIGNGDFERAEEALPQMHVSTSRVKTIDFDNDGDLDLFVGGRQVPGNYPLPAPSFLLRNDSNPDKIKFTDVTEELAPKLRNIGMVTDACWLDYNNDGWADLIVAGEWMRLLLLENRNGSFVDVSAKLNFDHTGWWFSISSSDLDLDGDPDVVAGNLGLNYKYKASPDEPFGIYSEDFDDNGHLDIVLAYYNENELYPLRGRTCSSQQIPLIKTKFENYLDFANANLIDVYGEEELSSSLHYEITNFASIVLINENGEFTAKQLDRYAQMSSVNVIDVADFNKDSIPDIFLAGNLFESEVETPRADASYGILLKGKGSGEFVPVLPAESGLLVKGEVRELAKIQLADGTNAILLSRNEDSIALIRINESH